MAIPRLWGGRPPARRKRRSACREVNEPALATVVGRALRNYLSASGSELAADLTSEAHVSLPAAALSLESVQHLDWAPGVGAVLAVVQAQDARGARYTLAYELDVARVQGRWEVSAIQTDPDGPQRGQFLKPDVPGVGRGGLSSPSSDRRKRVIGPWVLHNVWY